MFDHSPYPAHGDPSTYHSPQPSVLSPAAAYALAAQHGRPHTPESIPRRREPWQPSSAESPKHTVGNPYEQHLRATRRASDESEATTTKSADQQDRRWDEDGYELDANGYAIRLGELAQNGHRLGRSTTEDRKVLDEHDQTRGGIIAGEFNPNGYNDYDEEEDSPYPEVRASVSNIDDPEMPVLTFRTWTLGLTMTVIVSAANCFFMFRYPSPYITPIIVQILIYPIGKLMAYLPTSTWRVPRWLQFVPGLGDEFSFNPGPFNIKEHTIIVIMANVATGPAYGVNFTAAAEKFYNHKFGVGFDILLVLTTQMIGFGVAGLSRRFLVWPSSMIWPQNLVFCTLLNTLHAEDDDEDVAPGGKKRLSRYKFFVYVFIAAFFFYWLPGYLFTALSAFSFICWAAPNNVVVNQLFGVYSGLGMSLLTFDWSQINYLGSPLVIPWWAEVNIFAGFFIAFWVMAPIMYYTNVWETAYLPISSSYVFDRFGSTYNSSAVVDIATMKLNLTAYEEYSPLYLPITYAMLYGTSFMLASSVLVHTALYQGKGILRVMMKVTRDDDDIHMKLMRSYKEVPEWWYMIFLVIAVGLSIATIAGFDTQMPVWGLIVALAIGFIYVLPGGFVYAMTGSSISINLILELVAGYAMPDLPLANMLFKVYAYEAMASTLTFVQDLKLGHYMKVPPRACFAAQGTATFVGALVQVGVKRWLFSAVPDLCDPRQAAQLTCPNATVFYSSSVVWGLIGPQRLFGIGKKYNAILWWLFAGAVLPVFTWLAAKRWPKSWVRFVSVPVAMTGAIFMPPATGINFSSWIFVGFIFQFVLRRKYFRWWSKYNFILSAGLDSATSLSIIVIFLCLLLPKNGAITLSWWGNDVYANTLDYAGVSFKEIPPEGFGPSSGWA